MQAVSQANADDSGCIRAGRGDGISAFLHAGGYEHNLEAIPVLEIHDCFTDEGFE